MIDDYKSIITIKNNNNILAESSITQDESGFKYEIWFDEAGISRGRNDKNPRFKIKLGKSDKRGTPILIPTNIGQKPCFGKNCLINGKTKDGEHINSKDINKIFKFVLEYNDIMLMCYYLDGPIFDICGRKNSDDIIHDILYEFLNNSRNIAIQNLILNYKLRIKNSEFVPAKYRKFANNF